MADFYFDGTTPDGKPISCQVRQVTRISAGIPDDGTSYIGVVNGEAQPIHSGDDLATTYAAVDLMIQTLSAGNQRMATLTLVDGRTLYVYATQVNRVQEDPLNAGRCYLQTLEGSRIAWHVAGSVAATTAILNASLNAPP